MAAPEASCSSRNQAVEGPMLSGSAGRRAGRIAMHGSCDLAPDKGNKTSTPSLNSVTECKGIASNAFKCKSPIPKNASSTSVIHSSWIQRLKPSSQGFTAKDELTTFSKKESLICTHFRKDYSSCDRRLNNSTHHTRSSSWPPHGWQSKLERQLATETAEPGSESPERFGYAEAVSHDFNHQSNCLSTKNASQSSEAGSRTGSQQDYQKHFHTVEGFVPCVWPVSMKRHTLGSGRPNDLLYSKERDQREPESCRGQWFQDHIKGERKAELIALFEQAKPQGRSQQTHINNLRYFDVSLPTLSDYGSAPTLPLSVYGAGYSRGAGADADAGNGNLHLNILNEKEVHQSGIGEFGWKGKYPAAGLLRNKEKLDKFGLILPSKKEAVQDGHSMGLKDAAHRNRPQTMQNFNLFKGPAAKAYLQNDFSMGPSDNFHLSHFDHQSAGPCTRDETETCGYGSGTGWISTSKSQNVVTRGVGASCSSRYNLASSQNLHSGEEGQASRLRVSIKSLPEDAARARIREKSLEAYWNSWDKLIEDPDQSRPIKTGHSKASLQQDFCLGHHHEDLYRESLGANGIVNSCKSHKLMNFGEHNGSYDFDEQSVLLRKFSGPRINSRELIASSDHTSNFAVHRLEVSQEHYLYLHEGASGTVDTQPHNKNSGIRRWFLDDGSSHSRTCPIHPSLKANNNETSRKKSNMHRGWLQRWQSVGNVSASGKPLALYNSQSVSGDELTKLPKSCCASGECTVGSCHKDMSAFEGNLTESGRGSNRCPVAFGTHLAASAQGCRTAGQNFAAFRSGYVGPSMEALAIVGNMAGKQHLMSLQNRGAYRLPCARPKPGKGIRNIKDADEDTIHFVDLNDLNSLRGDNGGS